MVLSGLFVLRPSTNRDRVREVIECPYCRCRYSKRKQILYSLQYIHGIGPTFSQKILAQVGINPEVKADELTELEVNKS